MFETSIKSLQSLISFCVSKNITALVDGLSISSDYLDAKQITESKEKTLVETMERLTSLLASFPALKEITDVNSPDFIWNSTFIEVLNQNIRKKYVDFIYPSFDYNTYSLNKTCYDNDLPYFSTIVEFITLYKYADYLKGGNHNPIEPSKKTVKETDIKPKTQTTTHQTLEANLTLKQIKHLANCVNEARILKIKITETIMKNVFSCRLETPLQIAYRKNKLLAYFFSSLDNRSLITQEWQAICAQNKLFLSSNGTEMKQSNFSSAVSANNQEFPQGSAIIDKYFKELKEHSE